MSSRYQPGNATLLSGFIENRGRMLGPAYDVRSAPEATQPLLSRPNPSRPPAGLPYRSSIRSLGPFTHGRPAAPFGPRPAEVSLMLTMPASKTAGPAACPSVVP
jgi:hypothetical protein